MVFENLPHKNDRTRLSKKERIKYRDMHLHKCELTGSSPKGEVPHEIHHITPFSVNANNNPKNLMLVSHDLHQIIHKEAYRRSKIKGTPWQEESEYLSRNLMELQKLSRTLDGESPEDVYRRENLLGSLEG